MTAFDAAAAGLVALWTPLKLADDLLEVRRGAPISGDYAERMLLVEHDASPDARSDSTFETTWGDIGCTSIEERGQITCAVVVQVGDDDLPGAEAAAAALLGRAVSALNVDRTIGGAVGMSMVTTGSATQVQNARGVAVLVPVTVAYFATYAAISA